MKSLRTSTILAAALLSGTAVASDLDLSLESAGANLIVTSPGASVDWQVVGELDDAASEGLAMFSLTLAFDGGALTPAAAPTSGPMMSFDRPAGFTNPAGFGGTVDASGNLVQLGGAQNTINNSFAPVPTGAVTPGVALPGSPAVLASGSLLAPASSGSYRLTVMEGFVNVIREGETGTGEFWRVDASSVGVVTELLVVVLDCSAETYCDASPASAGCLASTTTAGSPTLTGADDFRVQATDVVNNTFGALFWSTAPDEALFGNGTLCLSLPLQRFPTQFTGGGPPAGTNCLGTLEQTINQGTMNVLGWTPGTTVYTQFFYRDYYDPDRIGLSEGTVFVVCP